LFKEPSRHKISYTVVEGSSFLGRAGLVVHGILIINTEERSDPLDLDVRWNTRYEITARLGGLVRSSFGELVVFPIATDEVLNGCE
jgi:hypothetical protein